MVKNGPKLVLKRPKVDKKRQVLQVKNLSEQSKNDEKRTNQSIHKNHRNEECSKSFPITMGLGFGLNIFLEIGQNFNLDFGLNMKKHSKYLDMISNQDCKSLDDFDVKLLAAGSCWIHPLVQSTDMDNILNVKEAASGNHLQFRQAFISLYSRFREMESTYFYFFFINVKIIFFKNSSKELCIIYDKNNEIFPEMEKFGILQSNFDQKTEVTENDPCKDWLKDLGVESINLTNKHEKNSSQPHISSIVHKTNIVFNFLLNWEKLKEFSEIGQKVPFLCSDYIFQNACLYCPKITLNKIEERSFGFDAIRLLNSEQIKHLKIENLITPLSLSKIIKILNFISKEEKYLIDTKMPGPKYTMNESNISEFVTTQMGNQFYYEPRSNIDTIFYYKNKFYLI